MARLLSQAQAVSISLEQALTELLLAKDYTRASATHRQDVLREFIGWAHRQQPSVTHVHQVTRPLIRRYLAYLRERPNVRYGGTLAGETQHSRASIVRMFLNFCVKEDWLAPDIMRGFEMPKKGKKVLQIFTREHYQRLVRATTYAAELPGLALRDQALLAVLLDTGLRAMEVCNLCLDDVFLSPGESYLHVMGKGRSEREIGLGRETALALHRYQTRGRTNTERINLFLNRWGAPLTPNAIDRMLTRLKRLAGPHHFVGVRVSAHTFRHSFAVHFLQQGGDVYKLSRLLGHETVQTTQRYLAAFSARDARLTSHSVLDRLSS